jgi:Raf kinase inhibitor-like YbhB/YbcL family protein
MDDPDAPSGLFTHWVAWNILASTSELPAGSLSIAIVEGRNGFGDVGYDGPAPPSGTHRYFFHLYALDMMLDLAPGSDAEVLSQAMKGHVVARAETMGTYAAGD